MSGIIHKIGEALHVGGPKAEDKHKEEHHGHGDEHKSGEHYKPEHHGEHYKPEHHGEQHGEHKQGLVEKVKDKIHGGEGHEGKDGDKKKKKKKDKKKHEDGHHHDSSSSDSD